MKGKWAESEWFLWTRFWGLVVLLVIAPIVGLTWGCYALVTAADAEEKQRLDAKAECVETGGTWVTRNPEWLGGDGRCVYPREAK